MEIPKRRRADATNRTETGTKDDTGVGKAGQACREKRLTDQQDNMEQDVSRHKRRNTRLETKLENQ